MQTSALKIAQKQISKEMYTRAKQFVVRNVLCTAGGLVPHMSQILQVLLAYRPTLPREISELQFDVTGGDKEN